MPILLSDLSYLSRIMSLLSQRPQRSLLSPIPPIGSPNPPIPCAAPHAIHPARPVADESCLPSAARTARPAQFSPLPHANRLGCPPNPAQSASPPHVPLGLTPAPDTTTAPLRGRLVSGAAGSVAGGGTKNPSQASPSTTRSLFADRGKPAKVLPGTFVRSATPQSFPPKEKS